jgi:hypothetical protein
MLKSILFLALIIPGFLNAQSKWKAGVVVSPEINYMRIGYKSKYQEPYYDTIHSFSSRSGITAGVSFTNSISSNFEMEYGLMYSRKAIEKSTNEKSNSVDHKINEMWGNYVMTPVKINYLPGNSNVSLFCSDIL